MSDDKKNKEYAEGYEAYRNPDHFKNTVSELLSLDSETYKKGAKAGREDRYKYGRTDDNEKDSKSSGNRTKERHSNSGGYSSSSSYSSSSYSEPMGPFGKVVLWSSVFLVVVFLIIPFVSEYRIKKAEAQRIASISVNFSFQSEPRSRHSTAFHVSSDYIRVTGHVSGKVLPRDEFEMSVTYPGCNIRDCETFVCPDFVCDISQFKFTSLAMFGQPSTTSTGYMRGPYTARISINDENTSQLRFVVFDCPPTHSATGFDSTRYC